MSRNGGSGADDGARHTSGVWFGSAGRPLLGWLTISRHASRSGVLVVPPVGYEYWSSARTIRTIAERLADVGHAVLRFDFDGTGDSAGSQWDPDRLEAWQAGVREGGALLRGLDVDRLCLVGVRLGGTLAFLEAAEMEAAQVVAWAPIYSGRRYARELRMLSTPVPESSEHTPGTLTTAGCVFSAQTLESIAELTMPLSPPAPNVLLIDEDGAGARVIEQWTDRSESIDHIVMSGGDAALGVSAEEATVPGNVVEAIVQRLVVPAGTRRLPAHRRLMTSEACLRWEGTEIRESVCHLTEDRLVGVWSEPAVSDMGPPVTVFLNPGSEPHIGPGRAWVEYARDLAVAGYPSLRLDFSGWGESPDLGHAPGRPYDSHCVSETIGVVRALREQGYETVIVVGLCASAWVALQAALRERIDGVVALNAALWWRPGKPFYSRLADAEAAKAAEFERHQRLQRWHLWSALDLVGHRPWAAAWLDSLVRRPTQTLLLFAEGDLGILYLRNRIARRTRRARASGKITVTELPDIDHPMHRGWLRHHVSRAILDHVRRIDMASPRHAPGHGGPAAGGR